MVFFSKRANLQSGEIFLGCESHKADAVYTRNQVASPSCGARRILTDRQGDYGILQVRIPSTESRRHIQILMVDRTSFVASSHFIVYVLTLIVLGIYHS